MHTLKTKPKEIDEAKQQYEHLVKIRKKYGVDKYEVDFTHFNNPKLRDVFSIFNNNDYAPVSAYESNVISTSGKPLLIDPKVIIVGDFEFRWMDVENSNGVKLFKDLLNRNLADIILSFWDEDSACEDILKIKKYSNLYKVPFIFDEEKDRQRYIKEIERLINRFTNKKDINYEEFVHKMDSIPMPKDISEDMICGGPEYIKGGGGYKPLEMKSGTLYYIRANQFAKEIEKRINNHNPIIQITSLYEVYNLIALPDLLTKKKIPFISYIPKHKPIFREF